MNKSGKVISTIIAGISAISICSCPTVQISADETAPVSVSAAASVSIKAGDIIEYSGDAYATSYGTGTPVKINGKFKIAQILDDTSRKCRVQLENVGWIPLTAITGEENKTPETPSLTEVKVGSKIKFKGDVYVTSYGTGNPVKAEGTYTISQILTDTTRKCRVQLKDIGWITMEAAQNSTLVDQPVENPAVEIKVGSTVKYNGNVYTTSYGTGDPVKVNGTFTISQILSDTTRKCRVQLKGIGWVSMNDLTSTSVTPPPVEEPTDDIKIGASIKYSGNVYATSFGSGNAVKVNGTFTIAQIIDDPSRKCPVQLKGVGWVSMNDITGNTTPVTPPVTNNTTEIKVGNTVQYSGNVYATSYGTGNSVKVNGTFTISAVLSDTTRKCRVQLKGIGWVSIDELKGITPSPTPTPPTPVQQPEIKAGDLVRYKGEVFCTCNGGKSVQVNGTYTVSKVIADRNVKYRIQLKGIGWISADNLVLS